MRLLPIVLVLGLLAAPAAATAKPAVGISDNNVAMFGDPLFAKLGAERVRLVVSYNAMGASRSGDNEISDVVTPYLESARERGIDVHVAFQHARGETFECDETPNTKPCRLPSVSAYKREVSAFLKRFPQVKTITAWNEANHFTQPTVSDPKRAGQFARAAEQACGSRCDVVAFDILDSSSNPTATEDVDYSRTVDYIKAARKAYGKKPAICGIHNYADVNRFRTDGTKTLSKALRCKSIWLTETGGLYRFASFWTKPTKRVGKCSTSANCQVAAMRQLFNRTVKAVANIDRVYLYSFYSGDDGRFDAGMVKGSGDTPDGKKRPAYDFVKKYF